MENQGSGASGSPDLCRPNLAGAVAGSLLPNQTTPFFSTISSSSIPSSHETFPHPTSDNLGSHLPARLLRKDCTRLPPLALRTESLDRLIRPRGLEPAVSDHIVWVLEAKRKGGWYWTGLGVVAHTSSQQLACTSFRNREHMI